MGLLVILIGWIAGVASMGRSLADALTGSAPALLILTACLFCGAVFRPGLRQSTVYRCLLVVLMGISSFLVGYLYADHQLEQRLQYRVQQPEQVRVIVYIRSLNRLVADGTDDRRVRQTAVVLNRHQQPVLWLLNTKYTWPTGKDPFQPGQYYLVSGKVRPAHSYAVAGAFDQERWLLQNNIMGSMQVQSIQPLTGQQVSSSGHSVFVRQQRGAVAAFQLYIEQKRLYFRTLINRESFVHQGLLLALLSGDESLLSTETREQFRRLGISHLLAISGPHVLIFAVIFCFAVNQLIRRFYPQLFLTLPRPDLLLIPFAGCVWMYTAFVGFEIPAMRTFLTVCLMSLIMLFRQRIQPLTMLLLSAGLLLLFDPFSILSAAFWLSYGACFILIRVYQTVQQQSINVVQGWTDKFRQFFSILIETQWKIFVALFPLILFIFQQISWVAPVANIIAIPFIGMLVVPLAVVGAFLSLAIEPVGVLLFHLADWALSCTVYALSLLDRLFSPELQWLAMTPWMLICLTLAVIILFLPKGVLPRIWALLCLFPLCIPAKQQNQFQLTVLDVGQGQAILMQLPGQNILVDTGGSPDETKFSIGRQVVIPYLTGQGVNRLDQVILSHLDQDHSGAFSAIQQQLRIGQVYSNEWDQRFAQSDFHYCHAGQQWQYGQIKVQILAPEQQHLSRVADNQNELSCVVYIQVPQSRGYQNFLIMGDAGWETEYQLLQKYPDLKVDVLILGHHGSQYSSSFTFLQSLQPKLAVASAGFDNRYGHPHLLVTARLTALSIPWLSTIQQGSIQFELDHHAKMQIRSRRETRKWLQR
ncbi:DNA internalization-related competence protein ComEC/Rec2 [Acinetobacter sp. WZC-1]|uniref:DNA internalization-related competence protein ComEC/Rec2 n=1 Tax=Acinetobacter sp. WZC-1 TaxID=3459034 RepID=UPI00403D9360